MFTFHRYASSVLACAAVAVPLAAASPVVAQSAGSYTSGSSYNPVQSAINRNSMNAAILRQAATGKHKAARKTVKTSSKTGARR